MIQKFNIVLLVICFLLSAGVLLKMYVSKRLVHIEKHIQWQDSIINQLRADKDSLRVTRTEFYEAVKLLNEKK